MCLETGWTITYVLAMPARQFFAFRKQMYEIEKEKMLLNLINDCDIQAISICNGDYVKELKNNYKNIWSGEATKKLATRGLDADNKKDTDIVAANLRAAFNSKARLMGIPR